VYLPKIRRRIMLKTAKSTRLDKGHTIMLLEWNSSLVN
jgi:hypothetical protein